MGLLKEELRRLGSLILSCADETAVEAGGALAVDRHGFAALVTDRVKRHPGITLVPGEVTEIPEGGVVIASGPLTSDALAERLQALWEDCDLHFYDAAAPLVSAESVDMERAWFGSRYDKGTADYINCPLDEAEYDAFWQRLPPHRRQRSTALRTARFLRAACRWRLWLAGGMTRCATAR